MGNKIIYNNSNQTARIGVQAEIVIEELTKGLYHISKSRRDSSLLSAFLNSAQVVGYMNSDKKVAVKSDGKYVASNFTIE